MTTQPDRIPDTDPAPVIDWRAALAALSPTRLEVIDRAATVEERTEEMLATLTWLAGYQVCARACASDRCWSMAESAYAGIRGRLLAVAAEGPGDGK